MNERAIGPWSGSGQPRPSAGSALWAELTGGVEAARPRPPAQLRYSTESPRGSWNRATKAGNTPEAKEQPAEAQRCRKLGREDEPSPGSGGFRLDALESGRTGNSVVGPDGSPSSGMMPSRSRAPGTDRENGGHNLPGTGTEKGTGA